MVCSNVCGIQLFRCIWTVFLSLTYNLDSLVKIKVKHESN